MKIMEEFVDKDPVKRQLKNRYEKTISQKNNESQKTKEGITVRRLNGNDEKLKERSKQNIILSRSLTKDEKEQRHFEDMKLMLNPGNVEVGNNDKDNSVPLQYNLSQNYPNPFNPVTKINFELPEDGKVKLIVYDLLGREILSLVNNELKTAGRYIMEFNGSNLASGVYFYHIVIHSDRLVVDSFGEANKFVQTKRMVLIK